jgi:fused signal recognition particle receptor
MMGFFQKFKEGLQKTHAKLSHEIKRIVTGSPRLTGDSLEELEAALLGADLGMAMTTQIVDAVRKAFETQGKSGMDVFEVAQKEVERSLSSSSTALLRAPEGPTVLSMVGVNGTGKTTTAAKLAHFLEGSGEKVILAACDTFRAAAIEQIKLWGQRLNVPVVSGAYGADPAAVAHDAIGAAQSRGFSHLIIDTAGRLHTKHNLMQELQKLHRDISGP